MRPLVVGIGSWSGDDAIGMRVAAAAADRLDVDVVEHADPAQLVHLMEGRDVVVVADAMLTGARPGQVRVLDADEVPVGAGFGTAGTHTVGIAQALDLARVLDRLPANVFVVGVEVAAPTGPGGLSDTVLSAVPHAVDEVTRVLTHHGPSTSRPRH